MIVAISSVISVSRWVDPTSNAVTRGASDRDRRRLRATPLDIPIGQAIPGSAAVLAAATAVIVVGREMVHLRLRRRFKSSFLKSRNVSDRLAREEQAALRRVATVVAHGAAPVDVFKAVAAEVASLLDSDLTLIGRYESDATFTYLAVGGQMPTSALVDRLTLGGNNLASNILRSGRPDSISYDDASGPIATFARTLGIRSAVGTPIIVDGRIWGAMLACWTQLQKTPSRTVDRIAEITELVATAVANADSRTALVESRARVAKVGDDMRRRIERDCTTVHSSGW